MLLIVSESHADTVLNETDAV